jgi:hypothetical protein
MCSEDSVPRACPQDWGLPDWHDAGQYPDHRVVHILVWAWEFLRRWPKYRAFWCDEVLPLLQRRAALPQRVEQLLAQQLNEQETREFVDDLSDLPPEELKEYAARLSGGPRIVSPPAPELVPLGGARVKSLAAQSRFGLWNAFDPRERECAAFVAGPTEVHAGQINRDPHKMTIEFDTRLPIKLQLKNAEDWLSTRQRRLKLRSTEPRPRVDLYAGYLRVLDAKEAAAGDRQIAEVLFPRLTERSGVQRVKNSYRAGRKLRDGGYRQLIA